MSTEEEFLATLAHLNTVKEPTTPDELSAYTALISEAIERCEKLMLYLATSPTRSEDMLTYLFEYKQLINFERKASELKIAPIIQPSATAPAKKVWWKFGK